MGRRRSSQLFTALALVGGVLGDTCLPTVDVSASPTSASVCDDVTVTVGVTGGRKTIVEQTVLDIVVVLDGSQSVFFNCINESSACWEDEVSFAKSLVTALDTNAGLFDNGGSAGYVTFSSTVRYNTNHQDMGVAYSLEDYITAVDALEAQEDRTAIGYAINRARTMLGSWFGDTTGHKQVIVVVTDGYDTIYGDCSYAPVECTYSPSTEAAAAAASGVTVYAVGVDLQNCGGSCVDTDELLNVANGISSNRYVVYDFASLNAALVTSISSSVETACVTNAVVSLSANAIMVPTLASVTQGSFSQSSTSLVWTVGDVSVSTLYLTYTVKMCACDYSGSSVAALSSLTFADDDPHTATMSGLTSAVTYSNGTYCTYAPTPAPTLQPTASPTAAPTVAPTRTPTPAPTKAPTASPTPSPTAAPTTAPTPVPTNQPTLSPTRLPTAAPTVNPTAAPTTAAPTTAAPTTAPTTATPTAAPTHKPTRTPTTASPTAVPTTAAPTFFQPTRAPTVPGPTAEPTPAPTATPTTAAPTKTPTMAPTMLPTVVPTVAPTKAPTTSPTPAPTSQPTPSPTSTPTTSPTPVPTNTPTSAPTELPTSQPTPSPTATPTTAAPTKTPTSSPTSSPTASPTSPTPVPTPTPTAMPTATPTTMSPNPQPTRTPTSSPTRRPTPTAAPTFTPGPTLAQAGERPTPQPTLWPTSAPTTASPTQSPTLHPTSSPTAQPTLAPTSVPTSSPTAQPTSSPTQQPTSSPTSTSQPTSAPTSQPTSVSTSSPTAVPTTAAPTAQPTSSPTSSPTVAPTAQPTSAPTLTPTAAPTRQPTLLTATLAPTMTSEQLLTASVVQCTMDVGLPSCSQNDTAWKSQAEEAFKKVFRNMAGYISISSSCSTNSTSSRRVLEIGETDEDADGYSLKTDASAIDSLSTAAPMYQRRRLADAATRTTTLTIGYTSTSVSSSATLAAADMLHLSSYDTWTTVEAAMQETFSEVSVASMSMYAIGFSQDNSNILENTESTKASGVDLPDGSADSSSGPSKKLFIIVLVVLCVGWIAMLAGVYYARKLMKRRREEAIKRKKQEAEDAATTVNGQPANALDVSADAEDDASMELSSPHRAAQPAGSRSLGPNRGASITERIARNISPVKAAPEIVNHPRRRSVSTNPDNAWGRSSAAALGGNANPLFARGKIGDDLDAGMMPSPARDGLAEERHRAAGIIDDLDFDGAANGDYEESGGHRHNGSYNDIWGVLNGSANINRARSSAGRK